MKHAFEVFLTFKHILHYIISTILITFMKLIKHEIMVLNLIIYSILIKNLILGPFFLKRQRFLINKCSRYNKFSLTLMLIVGNASPSVFNTSLGTLRILMNGKS